MHAADIHFALADAVKDEVEARVDTTELESLSDFDRRYAIAKISDTLNLIHMAVELLDEGDADTANLALALAERAACTAKLRLQY